MEPGRTGTPAAPTLIVSPLDPGHYRTISDAIHSAMPGTSIVVRPGLYTEELTINKPLKIIGDGAAKDIVIQSTRAPCILMQADHALVRNLTLHGQAARADTVNILRGHLEMEDCDITSDSSVGVGICGSTAAPVIRRCKIYGRWVGVKITQNGTGTVEDCDISGNGYLGVEISDGGTPVIRRCKIHGWWVGVKVNQSSAGTVEDCDIFGSVAAGLSISDGGNPVVQRCKIHGGKENGVWVSKIGRGRVEDCDIFENGDAGLSISDGGNPIIRRCKINRNSSVAVRVSENGEGSIEDCDVTDNAHGAWRIEAGSRARRSGNRDGNKEKNSWFARILGRRSE